MNHQQHQLVRDKYFWISKRTKENPHGHPVPLKMLSDGHLENIERKLREYSPRVWRGYKLDIHTNEWLEAIYNERVYRETRGHKIFEILCTKVCIPDKTYIHKGKIFKTRK